MIHCAIRTVFVLCLVFIAASVSAAPRDDTLELLRAISRGREGESVRVLVNGGDGGPVRIGDALEYRFESARSGYLTAIHVDTHGAATLLFPRANPEEGRLDSGQPIVMPAAGDEFSLTVQPPIGRDTVYAIVTDTPITRKDLGIDNREIVVSFEPHQSPALMRQLAAVLRSRPSDQLRVAHVVQQVDGRGEVQYRSAVFVEFFGVRPRSIRPAKLDLQLQFAIDSATLDEAARRNVDEFARALDDTRLRDMRFKVAGHTDSQGSESHNLGLSRRRADTVRSYLIEQGGIDESRLEIEAHGEKNPLMNEDSDYARRMNRRVEFTPVR